MQGLHRRCLPAVLALLVALALVPLTPHVAAADSDYAASCTVRLRASPSTSATSLITMPTGTVVTTTATVSGGSWSTTCVTSVSGSTWYAITAVDGTSVSSLYGVSVAYAAVGLFQPSTSPPPTPAVYLEGIDVSHYQGTIDWTQVPSAGKRFAIMKATEGQTLVDPMYAVNHAAARTVGLLFAAYHFAFPLSSPDDAVLQADWFAQNAALLPGDLVPALDLEQSGGLSTSDLQAWVGAWLGEVYAKLGVRPMIYTSPTFWANFMGNTTLFADQGYAVLWVAHWNTSSPTVPANDWGGHGWTFWQYSDCGSVAGISGCVDLDRYNGADLTGLTFNYSPLPPVTPPVTPANSPPILAALAPATVPAGGGDLSVSIQGADFASGVSAAYWNGTPLATTYVSPTQLTAVVPAALTSMPGTGSVTVLNQLPGGGTSAPAAFNVTMPVPLPSLDIGASSALGLNPATGYTTKTPKTQAKGKYVTWKFTGGTTLANQRVNVLVAKKINDAWGGPVYLKSAWADANGSVTFWYKSNTAAAINVRVQWPGSATYGVSTSRALGVYWK
jgi:GH25 family lysozyme M1 (1,4-beta-N-acetylmuramidase)